MNYKILMAVTIRADLVREKIYKIPDWTKLIIVNNYIDPAVEQECQRAEAQGSEIIRNPRNLGCGASCNLGLQRVDCGECDVIIVLAPSAKIIGDFEDLVALVEECESDPDNQIGRYQFSGMAKNHMFALNKTGVDIGGFYDEHFYPAYLEDTDWNWRSRHNGMSGRVKHFKRNDLVQTHGYSVSLSDPLIRRLHQNNSTMRSLYYQKKWGSHPPGKFIHPFNRKDLSINYWEPVKHDHLLW